MSTEARAEEILNGFHGDVPPVRAPLSYRFALLLVGIVMLVLPLIYLAICIAVGWVVYLHAVNNTAILTAGSGRGRIFSIILYLAPIVIGGTLVFFMFKPLFSRPVRRDTGLALDRGNEPLLFSFVDRVCDAVRAPRPSAIRVDCEVNASASFPGGLASMLRNDLVLTVGMPLAAGLSLQQLAGVLAHEFGHFSQGAGMRMSYLIRSISHWFTRVVYERDQFDTGLAQMSEEIDLRLGWVLLLSRVFVWISRKILWVLMMIGHLVSGFLLRQMEYDADRYETRLIGGDAFESTMRRITALSMALQAAHSGLNDARLEGKLPDDLARQAGLIMDGFTAENLQELQKAVDGSRTGALDTHPSDKDRIASARAEATSGVFHVGGPATDLFSDFPALARETTTSFYEQVFGSAMENVDLRPIEEIVAESERDRIGQEAQERYFLGTLNPVRPIPVPATETCGVDSTEADTSAHLHRLRADIKSGQEAYLAQAKRLDGLYGTRIQGGQVAALLDAGTRIEADKVQVPAGSAKEARNAGEKALAKIRALGVEMTAFEDKISERLGVAARQEPAERFESVVSLLAALNTVLPSILEVMNANLSLVVLLQNYAGNEENEKFQAAIVLRMKDVSERLARLAQETQGMEVPPDLELGKSTLRELLLPVSVDPDHPGVLADGAQACLHRAQSLRFRLAGELAQRAERAEARLGVVPVEAV